LLQGTNGGYVLLFLLLSWGYVLVTHRISQQASGLPKSKPSHKVQIAS
jgi:hypothetical protein